MQPSDEIQSNPSAIAVIGMSGRFPGAKTISEFWNNLRTGVESIRPVSDQELAAAGVDPVLLQDPNYVKAASVLDDIDSFDASFFGFSPKDAAIMDPQHRVFLECAWEALEHAGWTSDQFPGSIGVYAGSGMNSYFMFNLLPNHALMNSASLFLIKQTGNDKDVLATRISYQLNLTGPSMTVQTACSTSLVAVHQACQSLLYHECDMALAGGVTIEIPHKIGYLYREGEILSRDGHCRAFDADSTGTVFGSGAGMVVLRRLQDALQDGDCIHAVIRGTAINNDGSRKVGYLAPSVAGQAEVVLESLSVAGVDAESISYIETHGTGTSVGDPIEIAALTQAFRQSTQKSGFCGIGSLKTNIGHLDAAAGVAGLIKTVLALQHRQMPPSLHFSKPNPLIDFDQSPFYVNSRLSDWKTNGGPRRAGVTSLGIGGTNAHVILEEAPAAAASGQSRPWQILTISAKTAAALDSASGRLAGHLHDHADLTLADVAFTCHLGRKSFAYRRAVLCNTLPNAIAVLRSGEPKRVFTGHESIHSRIAFLFPGQGSQYVNMARGLYDSEAVFRSRVDFCCELLAPSLGFDLRTVLFPSEDNLQTASHTLAQTWVTQPALFVIEFALAKLWMSWGIVPTAMLGHSIGEFAAACISGVLSLEDALSAVASRGRLMQSAQQGAMLAIAFSEREAAMLLSDDISLAAINAPTQCVLSGTTEAINELEKALSRDRVTFHRLNTSHAFHSASMEAILGSFTGVMRNLQLKPPEIPYISNVTGTWIKPEEATNPVYWARHLRQTVRFSDGLEELCRDSSSLVLEVGPGGVLSGFAARRSSQAGNQKILSSVRSPHEKIDDVQRLLSTVAELWVSGAKVDWTGFHAQEQRRRLPLPPYPFERRRFWIDAPTQAHSAQPVIAERSDSAQIATESPLSYFRPVWKRSDLSPAKEELTAGNGSWLIFLDSMGLGSEIAKLLDLAGQQVVTVIPGERFMRISHNAYSLRPGRPSDYEQLIADIIRVGKVPQQIVHLWSVTPAGNSSPALGALEETQNLSFYSLLFLAQAIGTLDLSQSLHLGIVSNSLQQVAGETARHPERALLLGPCKLIPKEFSNVSTRSIDVVWPNPDPSVREELSRQIITELSPQSADLLIAYREDGRWVQEIGRTEIDPIPGGARLRQHGVYLITGGLGGVGFLIAKFLSQKVQAKLVLVGRTASRTPMVQALEKLGSEVLVAAADVTDVHEMNQVITAARARFGTIHGVIHAAGVLDDGLIQLKSRESAERVLAPKVKGTLVLDRVLKSAELDFFVLFSSISSLLTPIGQVDYVAANSFLDAFATSKRSNGENRIIAIDWSRWRNVGMASQLAQSARIGHGSASASKHTSAHPLLGSYSGDTPDARVYNTELSFTGHWVIHEHRLRGGDGLLPGTGYIELARAALLELTGPGAIQFQHLAFNEPFSVGIRKKKTVQISVRRDGGHYIFSATRDGARFTHDPNSEYATASVRYLGAIEPPRINLQELLRRCSLREETFGPNGQYSKQGKHIEFGPRWQCLKSIHFGEKEAVSVLELPEEFSPDLDIFRAHPALLDAATGSAMFAITDYSLTNDLYIPVSYKSFTLFSDLPARCYCHIRSRHENTIRKEVAAFDLTIANEDGLVIAEAEEFVLRRLSGAAILAGETVERGFKSETETAALNALAEADLAPAAGVEAFAAILAGAPPAQIIVAPPGLRFWREQAVPAMAAAASGMGRSETGAVPRDDVERNLAAWWEDLLGVERIGVRDDFFELGGHSLIAVRLFAKIKKHFGLDLGLATLFEARTIEALADLIRKELTQTDAEDAAWPSMIRIQTGAAEEGPLFFVHGLGGNVVGFSNLIRHLGPAESVYALQAQGLDGKQPILTKVEDMAARYISEIQTVQPQGPYYLVGYSFGGVVVFEMAQQLHAQGQEVPLVALFDTTQMHSRKSLGNPFTSPKMLGRYLRRTKELLSEPDGRAVAKQRVQNKLWQLLIYAAPTERVIRHMYKTDSIPLPRTATMIQAANIQAAVSYRPKMYPGRLTLFRATNRSIVDRYDAFLGWNGLATEGVEVHEVPGDHVSVGEEPNVAVMAAKFKLCVQKAREQSRPVQLKT